MSPWIEFSEWAFGEEFDIREDRVDSIAVYWNALHPECPITQECTLLMSIHIMHDAWQRYLKSKEDS